MLPVKVLPPSPAGNLRLPTVGTLAFPAPRPMRPQCQQPMPFQQGPPHESSSEGLVRPAPVFLFSFWQYPCDFVFAATASRKPRPGFEGCRDNFSWLISKRGARLTPESPPAVAWLMALGVLASRYPIR